MNSITPSPVRPLSLEDLGIEKASAEAKPLNGKATEEQIETLSESNDLLQRVRAALIWDSQA